MFCMSSMCSVLLSHTVLSELYQEKLVTEDEVERMKGEGKGLSERVVDVQCIKPPEVVTRTADVLDKLGHKDTARQLRGWWGSETTQQWTQCNSWASPPHTSLDYCLWSHLTQGVWGNMHNTLHMVHDTENLHFSVECLHWYARVAARRSAFIHMEIVDYPWRRLERLPNTEWRH